MFKRYVVVDQNVLRKPILQERLRQDPATRFVLPDLAFLEITKTNRWESTLRNSLRILSASPERVHVCFSVNQALDWELGAFRSIAGNMLNREATTYTRDILRSVQTGIDGVGMNLLREMRRDHIRALKRDHLNHQQNKGSLRELIDSTKSRLPSDQQKRLRAAAGTDSERFQLIHELVVPVLVGVLCERGLSWEKARVFIKRKPMVLRYLLVKEWYSVHWIQKGGFETAREEGITNDDIDQQYILSATFFDDLLSEEVRVNDCYRDLLSLLAMKA